jgi:hypothetical protein
MVAYDAHLMARTIDPRLPLRSLALRGVAGA